jgi:hypothetical protein
MAGVGWASAGQVAEAIRRREMSAVEALAEHLIGLPGWTRGCARWSPLIRRRRGAGPRRRIKRWPLARCGVRCTGWGHRGGPSRHGGDAVHLRWLPSVRQLCSRYGCHGGGPAEGGGGDRGG